MKKFFVSFLVTFLLSFTLFSLPSFAFDYYNFTDNSGITDSEYDSLLQSLLDQELYSENNFVMLRAVNSDGLIIVSILSFNRDYDWKLYIDNEGYYAVHLASDGDYVYRTNLYFYVFDTSSRTFSYYLGSLPDKIKAESNPYFSNCDIFRQGDYKNPIYHENTIVQDPNAFTSPVELKQVQFRESLEFYFSFTQEAADQLANSSNIVDSRCWIEIYDSATAIETLKFKPHKYVYLNKDKDRVIQDYLLAYWGGPYYEITQDTLLGAGFSPDSFYTARAYVYNGSKPYEIGNLTFKIDSDGLSTVEPDLHDPDHPDDPISKSWDTTNNTWVYNNTVTGEQVNKDDLIYGFNSSVDISVPGSGQDISDFDFNSDFSDDLVSGAGVVRTIFDKIIQVSGLSGFIITVLSIAIVGWFIFGSRR